MKRFVILCAMLSIVVFSQMALAKDSFDAKHKVVIQVSTNDELTQKIAMNNAVNLQKLYGLDDVAIEIVAYGPGLSMLTAQSNNSSRVKSLAAQNITFSACGNTMKKIAKKKGKEPKLTEGVGVVNAGVARIVELQASGYAYIRP
ncbi:MAG: DsrE family protein [Gammaproteobacteria bacterium]|nr:DsrE family protein [Gammaproteobacteria bacterium]MDH5730203.1 DsrE family protein [Gammaproteobacteria bacterium]